MPRAIRNVLEGREAEVIEYIENYGRMESCRHFGFHDYIAWDRYITETLKKDDSFGLRPRMKPVYLDDRKDAFTMLVEAFEKRAIEWRESDEKKDNIIAALQAELHMLKEPRRFQVQEKLLHAIKEMNEV